MIYFVIEKGLSDNITIWSNNILEMGFMKIVVTKT